MLDVAQQVVRLHEVIAGVEVAVMLHGQGVAAGFVEDAYARGGELHPVGQRRLEGLDKDLAYVVEDPFVEDGAEKTPELLGLHRAI